MLSCSSYFSSKQREYCEFPLNIIHTSLYLPDDSLYDIKNANKGRVDAYFTGFHWYLRVVCSTRVLLHLSTFLYFINCSKPFKWWIFLSASSRIGAVYDDAARERAGGCLHKLIESTMRLNQLDEYSLGYFVSKLLFFRCSKNASKSMYPTSEKILRRTARSLLPS